MLTNLHLGFLLVVVVFYYISGLFHICGWLRVEGGVQETYCFCDGF